MFHLCTQPRNQDFNASELLALCFTTHVFIGGDFNVYHKTFGIRYQNRDGHHIVEVLENIPEAILLNKTEPTHIARNNLDLTFIS